MTGHPGEVKLTIGQKLKTETNRLTDEVRKARVDAILARVGLALSDALHRLKTAKCSKPDTAIIMNIIELGLTPDEALNSVVYDDVMVWSRGQNLRLERYIDHSCKADRPGFTHSMNCNCPVRSWRFSWD